MFFNLKVVIILVLVSISMGSAQELTLGSSDTINFNLTAHNNIAIESVLNDTDTLSLMFHTAVGSVSLTPDCTERIIKNAATKSSDAKSWSGSEAVEFIEGNKLQITELSWDSITVWLNLLSGHDTDGKFGPNLFGDRFIEINFDDELIVLHENIDSILEGFATYKIVIDEHDSMFLEGVLSVNDQGIKNEFMIHTGYGGTIILDDQFYKDNKSIQSLKVIEESDLKDSFGNVIKTKKAIVDKFQLCGMEFQDVPISYFDSELEIQNTSVLGGAMLKRFNMIFDLKEMKIHVKPNKHSKAKFKTT